MICYKLAPGETWVPHNPVFQPKKFSIFPLTRNIVSGNILMLLVVAAVKKIRRDFMVVSKSDQERLYRLLMGSEDSAEQYNVAMIFGNGSAKDGIPQDVEKSKNLMLRSASLGYQPAKDFLAKVANMKPQ